MGSGRRVLVFAATDILDSNCSTHLFFLYDLLSKETKKELLKRKISSVSFAKDKSQNEYNY